MTRMSDLLISLWFDMSMGTDISCKLPSVGFAVHMLYLLYFLNKPVCNIVTPCGHDESFCTFMISSLNFLKSLPCSGFVNISAAMFPVGQYTTLTSFLTIMSLIQKYLTLICLVRFLLEILPFWKGYSAHIILIYRGTLALMPLCFQKVSGP